MKINAVEMMSINKNLKFKGDETESENKSSSFMTEVPEEGKENISALNAQSMNNITFQGLNTAGLKKMGLNAMIALTLFGGAAALQSCTEEPGGNTYITDNTKVITTITVNIYMTDEELVNAVLEEIKALRQEQKEQTEINKAILAELINQGISLDRILTLLEKMNMTASDIFNMLKENTDKQDQILEEMSKGNKEIKEQLIAILNAINEGKEISANNNNLLTQILVQLGKSDENDQAIIDILNKILAKVNESIKNDKAIAARQQQLLFAILGKLSEIDNHLKQGIIALLDKMEQISDKNIDILIKIFNSIDDNNKNDEKTQAILIAIFNKVQESIDTNKEMNEKTQILLQSILDNIQNFNGDLKAAVAQIIAKMDQLSDENKILLGDILNNIQNFNDDMKTGFANVINNMDKMSEENRAFFEQILAKIDKLDDNAKKGLAMLINQMATSNTLNQMQLDRLNKLIAKLEQAHQDDLKFYNQAIALLSELLSKVDNLGDKADTIIDVIGNISIDADVDLSTIENMLKQILDQSKANGDVLTSIDGKMNLLAITLEGIKTQIEQLSGDNEAILKKLDEILAKIPDKCNCNVELKIIIEKLETIIEEVKKGNNHEGILDDLDDLFQ